MKRCLLLPVLFCCASLTLMAQEKAKEKNAEPAFEIKQYFFVMLTSGPHRNQDSVTAARIQDGHIANIRRLHEQGKILVAGPFGDDSNWRGIFIFDCATKEEVESLLKTDPAISAGRLGYDIRPWYTAKNCLFK